MNNKVLELPFNFSDITKLSLPGVLGQYTGYKITTVVATKGKDSHNLLTSIVAVEPPFVTTNELKSIPIFFKKIKGWRYMVTEHFIEMDSLEQVLTEALELHRWETNGKFLFFGDLSYCGHWYVPPCLHTCGKTSPISKIVSNGGDLGAHVWEWGEEKQGVFSDFFDSPPLLRDFSKEVSKITGYDIELLSDRLGNVLISLPVTTLNCEIHGIPNTLDGIRIKPVWAQGVKPRQIIAVASKKKDGMISQQLLSENNENFEIKNNENTEQDISIYDTENDVLLYSSEVSIMRHLFLNSSICCNDSSARKFVNSGNKESLTIYSNIKLETGYKESKALNEKLKQRLYRETAERLHNELELVQYNPGKPNILGQIYNIHESRANALTDLRSLINKYGKTSVYLWDPFLSADDIIDTLFYNQNYGAQMRAITRGKGVGEDSEARTQTLLKYGKELSDACIYPYGLFIEFRSTINGDFADFHDRFLIFPDVKPYPLVWSLGTSVNSVGKSHHLLLKVQHGQMIIDAFEQMWAESNKPEQLIWKSPGWTI